MVVIDENDIGKTNIQILMDLIYESQGVRIPEEHITYGNPEPLDQRPEVLLDANTYIPVRIDPLWDDRFNKNSGFMYRRRTLDEHLRDLNLVIQIDVWPITTRELLELYINPLLEFPIDPLDIVDYTLPDPEATSVLLMASPHSFLWCGRFSVTTIPIDPNFFNLVTVQSLNGFNQYVNP